MTQRATRHPARSAAIAGALLHALALAMVWRRHGAGTGGLVVFWMDFPVSLAYAAIEGRAYWIASLVAGGALWSAAAALFATVVGRLARRA